MSDKLSTVAVAIYGSEKTRDQDFDVVQGAKHEGQIDHLAVTTLHKEADGDVKIDRHDSTAKHLAWGGGILGGLLTVIAAPVGIVFLGDLAVSGAAGAGVGGLIGHFWHNIPKDEARAMGDLLENGDYGLIIVAVNPRGVNIDALLAGATKKIVKNDVADPNGELEAAFEETKG